VLTRRNERMGQEYGSIKRRRYRYETGHDKE
jgi:hypothetical protein